MKSTLSLTALSLFTTLAITNAEPAPFIVDCTNWPPSKQAECSSLHGGSPSSPPPQPTGPPPPASPHTYGDPCVTLPPSLKKECYATNHPFPIPTFPPGPPGAQSAPSPPGGLSGLSKFLKSFDAATATGESSVQSSDGGEWITSTVYATNEITISSCAESVTNCPYRVTSSVMSWTTAVPVVPTSAAPAPPSVPVGTGAAPTYPGPAPTGTQTALGSATSGYIQVTAAAGRREIGALGVVAGVVWALL